MSSYSTRQSLFNRSKAIEELVAEGKSALTVLRAIEAAEQEARALSRLEAIGKAGSTGGKDA